MATKRNLLMAKFVAGVFLYWMSLYLYMPTLPVYARSKTTHLAMVGVALSMYGLWQAVARLPLGIVVDWAGRRKPFILAGFMLAGLGSWWMGIASGIEGVILGRAVTGFAAAAWVPMIVAYSSLFPREEAARAAAGLTLVNSISRMFATLVTGSLNELGGYGLAFRLATGSAGLALLIVLPVKEICLPTFRPSWKGIRQIIARRDVTGPSLLNAVLQYAVWSTIFGFTPILAHGFGASDVQQSLLVTLSIGLTILGNLSTASCAKRFSDRRVIQASIVLFALGIGSAAAAPNLAWVFFSQALIGLAGGIGYPLLMGMSIANVEENQRNTAMGLHQAVYGIGMFAGPWLSGILADAIGVQPMFAWTAAAVLLVGLGGVRLLLAPPQAD
jgi:MFS family permease